jgi:hypothetical protein
MAIRVQLVQLVPLDLPALLQVRVLQVLLDQLVLGLPVLPVPQEPTVDLVLVLRLSSSRLTIMLVLNPPNKRPFALMASLEPPGVSIAQLVVTSGLGAFQALTLQQKTLKGTH